MKLPSDEELGAQLRAARGLPPEPKPKTDPEGLFEKGHIAGPIQDELNEMLGADMRKVAERIREQFEKMKDNRIVIPAKDFAYRYTGPEPFVHFEANKMRGTITGRLPKEGGAWQSSKTIKRLKSG